MSSDFQQLDNFIRRLKKLGIELKIGGNFPWCYLDSINGQRVKEKNASEHGFTIGYLGKNGFDFVYLHETIKLIRKYV
jgi:hypothetical protein